MKKIIIASALMFTALIVKSNDIQPVSTTHKAVSTKAIAKDNKKDVGTGDFKDNKKDVGTGDFQLADNKKDVGTGDFKDNKKDVGTGDFQLVA